MSVWVVLRPTSHFVCAVSGFFFFRSHGRQGISSLLANDPVWRVAIGELARLSICLAAAALHAAAGIASSSRLARLSGVDHHLRLPHHQPTTPNLLGLFAFESAWPNVN